MKIHTNPYLHLYLISEILIILLTYYFMRIIYFMLNQYNHTYNHTNQHTFYN